MPVSACARLIRGDHMIFGRDLGRNLEFIRADISSCKVAGNRFRTLLVFLELVTRHGDIFFQLIDQISFALVQDGKVSVGIEVFQFYLFVGTDDDFHIGAFARKGNGDSSRLFADLRARDLRFRKERRRFSVAVRPLAAEHHLTLFLGKVEIIVRARKGAVSFISERKSHFLPRRNVLEKYFRIRFEVDRKVLIRLQLGSRDNAGTFGGIGNGKSARAYRIIFHAACHELARFRLTVRRCDHFRGIVHVRLEHDVRLGLFVLRIGGFEFHVVQKSFRRSNGSIR